MLRLRQKVSTKRTLLKLCKSISLKMVEFTNRNLGKIEIIRVLTTGVDLLAFRSVLLMIRVPIQAFLATTYKRLRLRASYTKG